MIVVRNNYLGVEVWDDETTARSDEARNYSQQVHQCPEIKGLVADLKLVMHPPPSSLPNVLFDCIIESGTDCFMCFKCIRIIN